jgi:hypothetical protein
MIEVEMITFHHFSSDKIGCPLKDRKKTMDFGVEIIEVLLYMRNKAKGS